MTVKRAMLMAAGLGTRLKPFTESEPKALLPVITGDTSPAPQSDSSTDALVRRYRTERGRTS